MTSIQLNGIYYIESHNLTNINPFVINPRFLRMDEFYNGFLCQWKPIREFSYMLFETFLDHDQSLASISSLSTSIPHSFTLMTGNGNYADFRLITKEALEGKLHAARHPTQNPFRGPYVDEVKDCA